MGKNQKVLFHSTIFGPIHSRRLGVSLGINLMPDDGKVCTFDCLYCEAGFNNQGTGSTGLPSPKKVEDELTAKLLEMKKNGEKPDVITFSGNGEPTLHPKFGEIIDRVIKVRNNLAPDAKVSVLSNSTCIDRKDVVEALNKVDNNILKLDSAIESTMRLLDRPASDKFTVNQAVQWLAQFKGNAIVQTLFVRGKHNGVIVDNTTPEEIDALISAYKRIDPKEVMVYTIDRSTPEENLEKISPGELDLIKQKIESNGIKVA